jgi:surface antigen
LEDVRNLKLKEKKRCIASPFLFESKWKAPFPPLVQNRSVQKIKQLQTQAHKAMTVLTKIKPSFKKTAVSGLLSLAAAVPSSVALSQIFASPSEAASTCECVGYVKNRFGITAAVGDAKDMIHSLPRHGFTRVNSPQPGAVVIMQPTFRGAHPRYGHVGIVERTSVRSGSTYLTVRGSNQGGRMFEEFRCTNVAIVDFATPVNGRSDVTYWVKGNTPPPPTNPIRSVSFSATSASGGIKGYGNDSCLKRTHLLKSFSGSGFRHKF